MAKTLVKVAGSLVFTSAMRLLKLSGEVAPNNVKLLIHVDLIALCISMTVFIAGMTVGPTFWRKIQEGAVNAISIAIVANAFVMHQIVLMSVGDHDFWLRRFINVLFTAFVGFCCVILLFMLRSVYGTKVKTAG